MAKFNNAQGYINHYGAVRLRLNGNGSLRLKLISLDGVIESTLLPLTMSSASNIEPTRICNFNQQRAQLEIKTTAIDERFFISKIVIYTQPVAENYPG